MFNTRVRFVETESRILSRLDVSALAQPRLLRALTDALFNLRVQLVRYETRVSGERVRAQLYIVEFDGAPISPRRRSAVQAAVMHAIEEARAEAHAPVTHAPRLDAQPL